MEIEAYTSHHEDQYALPASGFGHLLARVAGGVNARWCVRNVLDQAAAHSGSASDVAVGLLPAGKAS